jgi:hypothetical protein
LIEKVGSIKNPLTVIAMFAAIAEISGTTVLPFIAQDNQSTYVWFLMLFPVLLVGVFFLTLNFNHKVLYAPSDYKDENNFLKLFGSATLAEKEEKLREEVEEVEEAANKEPEAEAKAEAEAEAEAKAAIAVAAVQAVEKLTKAEMLRPQPAATINPDRHRDLISNLMMAEKLAIMKLSKELGLDFKADVRYRAPGSRIVVFDALGEERHQIHAVEVKLFRAEYVNPMRLERTLLEAESIAAHLNGIGSKEFVLHFFAVIDSDSVDRNALRERLATFVERYKVNVRIHVATLRDLQAEYQYGG